MTARAATEPLAPYLQAFEKVRARPDGSSAQRAAAFARFVELGFPHAREEAWKYTSLRRLQARHFELADTDDTAGRNRPTVAALAEHQLMLIDGHPLIDSLQQTLPAGLRVRTLAQASSDGEGHASLLRIPEGGGTERFAALNAALCPEAVLIDIEPGAQVDPALHIVLATSGSATRMSHPRILLRAGKGSLARIIVHHTGSGEAERFVNAYLDIEVGADALLHVYRLLTPGERAFHIERVDATIGQRGNFLMHDAQLGGSMARLDLNARLAAPGASAELTGLFMADGSRHFDTQVRADHLAPDTRSLQDYRGIAAGRGRAVFNSKALVHPGAQKSNARQVSRNLLLSKGAEIDTKPELEIYADDVQCSHGATTGQLDKAALFYLRTRGLSENEARSALTRAFAGAVLSRMDHEAFAGLVHRELDARLAQLLDEPL